VEGEESEAAIQAVTAVTKPTAESASQGESLYRELLFPNAAAAKRVPALARVFEFSGMAKKNADQLRAMTAIQDALVANIKKTQPDFFDRFAKQITSGDVLLVEAALREAGTATQAAMATFGKALQAAASQEGIAELGRNLAQDPKSEMLSKLTSLDPKIFAEIVGIFREHVEKIPEAEKIVTAIVNRGVTSAPHVLVDIDHIILDAQTVANTGTNIDINSYVESVGDVTVEVETVVYVAVAIAVAVAAVVVLVVERPTDSSLPYVNGREINLFREQMIGQIATAYAR
jgi:SdpC family antimicrobial peptide